MIPTPDPRDRPLAPSGDLGPLSLDTYATVAAHLLHAAGKPIDLVLAELGIDAGVWRASAARWERALDDELAQDNRALLTAFSTRLVATRAALARGPTVRAPAVPDLPILPDTVALKDPPVSRPVLPFSPSPTMPSPKEDAARFAVPGTALPFCERPPPQSRPDPRPPAEPPPSLLIGPTTARIDARWLPPSPLPEPSREAAAIPLVRKKRKPRPVQWLAWLRAWLFRRLDVR